MGFSNELKNNIQPTYSNEQLANVFYKPVLREADTYKRVSAYFSSAGLELYSRGIDELFQNGGLAKFVVSTNISESDFEKIKRGYEIKDNIKNFLDLKLKCNTCSTRPVLYSD